MTKQAGLFLNLGGAFGIGIGLILLPWVSLTSVDAALELLKTIPIVGGAVVTIIQHLLSLDGWQMATLWPLTSGLLRLLIFSTVGIAICALISLKVTARQFCLTVASLCAVVIILLVLNIPTVLALGSDDNQTIMIAAATAGAKIGWGFWVILLSLGLIIAGQFFNLSNDEADNLNNSNIY